VLESDHPDIEIACRRVVAATHVSDMFARQGKPTAAKAAAARRRDRVLKSAGDRLSAIRGDL